MTDKPAQVFSLAEYLCEEMEAREWTAVDVAQRMGGEYSMNKMILDLTLAITPTKETCIINDDTFAGLAKAFGTSEDFFKNLHAEWTNNPDARSPFECPDHLFGPDWERAVLK